MTVCGRCYDLNFGHPKPDCPVCGEDGVFSAAEDAFQAVREALTPDED